jgi:hypothetical protein
MVIWRHPSSSSLCDYPKLPAFVIQHRLQGSAAESIERRQRFAAEMIPRVAG